MLKVMVVDDDINVHKCLRKLVPWEEIGCMIVAEANDGMEGLQRFHETRPDVIITDLKMPGMDGEIFCQKVRGFSDKVSIIFLSAYESFTAAQISLHYGVSEYILKPIDSRKIAMITDILKGLSTVSRDSKFLHSLVTDNTQQEYLLEQIRIKNTDYFEKFFQNMSAYSNHDFVLAHTIANVLINLLFEVMDELPEDNEVLDLKRQQILAQFNSLPRIMDIVSYTNEIFNEYLMSEHDDMKMDFNYKIIEQIKSYVTENINDSQLSVSVIADYFDFSDGYLGRIFKKYTDVSLISYITHIRLNQACRYLQNTQFTIAEIAQMVGYSNSNYFCRVFKKQLNTTPNDFRNRPSCRQEPSL